MDDNMYGQQHYDQDAVTCAATWAAAGDNSYTMRILSYITTANKKRFNLVHHLGRSNVWEILNVNQLSYMAYGWHNIVVAYTQI